MRQPPKVQWTALLSFFLLTVIIADCLPWPGLGDGILAQIGNHLLRGANQDSPMDTVGQAQNAISLGARDPRQISR